MKKIRIFGHPVCVIITFLLILISGEQFGGFYVLYILLGLPYGAPHSLLACAGILLMILAYNIHGKKTNSLRPFFQIISTGLMALALILFFDRSKGYNNETFTQALPSISLFLFGICAFCNVFVSVLLCKKGNRRNINLGIIA